MLFGVMEGWGDTGGICPRPEGRCSQVEGKTGLSRQASSEGAVGSLLQPFWGQEQHQSCDWIRVS